MTVDSTLENMEWTWTRTQILHVTDMATPEVFK